MSADRDLSRETAAADALRNALTAMGADEETLRDTIEGGCNLHDAIAAVMSEITECQSLQIGLGQIIEDLRRRYDGISAREDRLRAAIEHAMVVGEIKTLVLPEATLTVKSVAPKLQVTDEAAIPARFWQPSEPKLSKRMLAEALKGGEQVPGATMDNGGITLQIRR